jgi:hypothetical protein
MPLYPPQFLSAVATPTRVMILPTLRPPTNHTRDKNSCCPTGVPHPGKVSKLSPVTRPSFLPPRPTSPLFYTFAVYLILSLYIIGVDSQTAHPKPILSAPLSDSFTPRLPSLDATAATYEVRRHGTCALQLNHLLRLSEPVRPPCLTGNPAS